MRTADLTGALLDYWVARAEGIPADQLEIREAQRFDPRTPGPFLVRKLGHRDPFTRTVAELAIPYSSNWNLCGPLIEKYLLDVLCQSSRCWSASTPDSVQIEIDGTTVQIAICRAVVRHAFGDEVEDLPC